MPFQESFPLTNSEPGSFSPFWPPKSSVRKRSPSSTRSPSAGWKGSVQLTEAVPEKLGVYLLMLDLSNTTPVGRSEEHTSELQSLMRISYAVFCLKKKKTNIHTYHENVYTNKSTTDSEQHI